MAELTSMKADGTEGGTITVDDAMFSVTPNVPLMHQVVTAQLAAARAGTQSTKTRAEVSGGGAKPFKQKGTGRSRQGSTRAPQWTGGGVALGPKPRSYKQRTPKKMVRAALRSALSDRFAEGRVVVLEDGFGFTEPKTRNAAALLDALDLEGSILVVVDREDEVALKAFRNLPYAQLVLTDELNAYDILCHDWILFTEATLPKAREGEAAGGRRRATGAAGIAASTTELEGDEGTDRASEPDGGSGAGDVDGGAADSGEGGSGSESGSGGLGSSGGGSESGSGGRGSSGGGSGVGGAGTEDDLGSGPDSGADAGDSAGDSGAGSSDDSGDAEQGSEGSQS